MADIQYSIKRSRRARRVSISVSFSKGVTVTLPWFSSEKIAEKFVISKSNWIQEALQKTEKRFAGKTILKQTKGDYKQNKDRALEFVKNRLEFFNKHYGFKINSIRIKNHGSRWGSCSAKGNLNFNYAIIHLPADLADYIVVHELCHLGELNHGRRFWSLVAESTPDYKLRRKMLRHNYVQIS